MVLWVLSLDVCTCVQCGMHVCVHVCMLASPRVSVRIRLSLADNFVVPQPHTQFPSFHSFSQSIFWVGFASAIVGSTTAAEWRWCDTSQCDTGQAWSTTAGNQLASGDQEPGLDLDLPAGTGSECANYRDAFDYLINEDCFNENAFVCEYYLTGTYCTFQSLQCTLQWKFQ